MQNFIQKLMIFMRGRYGTDTFNNFLFVVTLIIWFVNIFVFNNTASLILSLIQLAIFSYLIFRALSRNINRRCAENRKFLKIYNPAKNWFMLTKRKFKERKDFKYIKCPACKAQLRVKNQKGTHTVCCPKCKSEFKKKI